MVKTLTDIKLGSSCLCGLMSCPSGPGSSKNKTRNIHTPPSAHKGPAISFILKASLVAWLSCHQPCHGSSGPLSPAPQASRRSQGVQSWWKVRKDPPSAFHPVASRCPPHLREKATDPGKRKNDEGKAYKIKASLVGVGKGPRETLHLPPISLVELEMAEGPPHHPALGMSCFGECSPCRKPGYQHRRLFYSTDQPSEPPNPVGGGCRWSLLPSRIRCEGQR